MVFKWISFHSLICYSFFIFRVTSDDISEIILKIKITFHINGNEIPEVWNKAKFRDVVRKKMPPTEGYIQHNSC